MNQKFPFKEKCLGSFDPEHPCAYEFEITGYGMYECPRCGKFTVGYYPTPAKRKKAGVKALPK